jgi:hypothetical protein
MNLMYLLLFRPFSSRIKNVIEIFNEFCILACSYSTIIFTDFLDDEVMQYNVGWVVITFTLLNMVSNMLVIMGLSFITYKSSISKLCQKLKNRVSKSNIEKAKTHRKLYEVEYAKGDKVEFLTKQSIQNDYMN